MAEIMTDFEFAVNNVVLTLTNEGRLYNKFLRMARTHASIYSWRLLVAYEYNDTLSPMVHKASAKALREYYAQHIAEF